MFHCSICSIKIDIYIIIIIIFKKIKKLLYRGGISSGTSGTVEQYEIIEFCLEQVWKKWNRKVERLNF